MGYGKSGSTRAKAIGDLLLIAFYYLLCIGKYTVKGKRNNKKQTVQFKLEDVITFFKKNKVGTLVCLPRTAPASVVMAADSATLKLDNQKKWVERCVCPPGGKWGIIQLSRTCSQAPGPSPARE
jgi:hypothetical protein